MHFGSGLRSLLLFGLFLGVCIQAQAQTPALPGQPVTLENAPQRDTTNRNADPKWRDEPVRITYQYVFSQKKYAPDTSIENLHRRIVSLPLQRDLGNLGSPSRPLYFEPRVAQLNPSLGFTTLDLYRWVADSMAYYNTTRPYTDFNYTLGSKLEQNAYILHTQNILPNWNVAARYRKITSPGFFLNQRNNHDNASFTTHYASPLQHYELFAAITYNSLQHDENGGVISDSTLSEERYGDRSTVPVLFNEQPGNFTRSYVFNNLRDLNAVVQHSYTWGRVDTLYAADSASYRLELTPRFRIAHRFDIGSQRHIYSDRAPDSADYAFLFSRRFSATNGLDSVSAQQNWNWFDNSVSLNGLFGKLGRQLQFTVGAGLRTDKFTSRFKSGSDNSVGGYVFGQVEKEDLGDKQWFYQADAKLFVTGEAAGNFQLRATVGRDLGSRWGSLKAGFRQQLVESPYAWNVYQNNYYNFSNNFAPESQTLLYGELKSPRLNLTIGVRNWLLGNYLYVNEDRKFDQYASAFNLSQVYVGKTFRLGKFVSHNELTLQQVTGNGPVNVPKVTGRHTIGIETFLFVPTLRITTGIEARYHTAYYADGYTPFFNQFYYQRSTEISNIPEASAFFNFRVKRFRAFLMGDQLQQFLITKNIRVAPGYYAQNAMIRFGFSWVMVN